jgi:hypothetical protein
MLSETDLLFIDFHFKSRYHHHHHHINYYFHFLMLSRRRRSGMMRKNISFGQKQIISKQEKGENGLREQCVCVTKYLIINTGYTKIIHNN